jgi:hypothetical protein
VIQTEVALASRERCRKSCPFDRQKHIQGISGLALYIFLDEALDLQLGASRTLSKYFETGAQQTG